MKPIFGSLSVRLFMWLLVTTALTSIAIQVVNFRSLSKLYLAVTYDRANQAGQLIERATHYGMLLNRKDDVHQTIRQIAREPGIHGIRVYDKNGTIMFSTEDREIGTKVDLQADACILCHDRESPLRSLPDEQRMRVYTSADGSHVLGLINPIENSPECSNNACHAHPEGQSILGVLDLQYSLAGLGESVASTKRQLLAATLIAGLVLASVTALLIYRLVHVPVVKMIDGTRRVAAGDLTTRIDIPTSEGLAELARSFNRMTLDLSRARSEIVEWSQQLEQKVIDKTAELGRTQRQVVQMEKMASLGKLAASVAHEINNPLAGILNYAKLLSRCLREGVKSDEERDLLLRYLTHIESETMRCGDIVRNLLTFARKSEVVMGEHAIKDIVDRSLMVVRHHLEMARVQVDRAGIGEVGTVHCDANQISQALVALFVNASEAMPEGGTLTVGARRTDAGVEIAVEDTGVGIAEEHLAHVFEPYFSTKDKPTGVGLGLAITYGIIQRHGGRIEVTSQVGQGTRFVIFLPHVAELREG